MNKSASVCKKEEKEEEEKTSSGHYVLAEMSKTLGVFRKSKEKPLAIFVCISIC